MMADDVRLALRALIKRPGFSAVVILTVALGIGATTGALSIADAFLARPVPYQQPEQLLALFASLRTQGSERVLASYPDVHDWGKGSQTLSGVAAFNNWRQLNLSGGDSPTRVAAAFVSPGYFEILGVRPALGVTFSLTEDNVPEGSPVVVLSHSFWLKNFGGDPSVVGKSLTLADQVLTVKGVMPADFEDMTIIRPVDVWVPASLAARIFNPGYTASRGQRWVIGVGRMKPGVTIEQVRSELDGIANQISTDFPTTSKDYGVSIHPIADFLYDFRDTRQSGLILLVGSVFVLLIGCFNIAGLMMVRMLSRSQEFATLLALGGDRRRVFRQLLTESLVLSLVGGALGAAFSYWAVKYLVALSPVPLPDYLRIAVDAKTLIISFGVTMLTGLVAGLAPAWSSSRISLRECLQEGARQVGASRGRALGRGLLLVVEVAVAVSLLIGAGLLLRSFRAFQQTDLGIETDDLWVSQIDLGGRRYAPNEAKVQFYRQLTERVGAISGVTAGGLWGPGLPGRTFFFRELMLEGAEQTTEGTRIRANDHRVSPGAITQVGIPLLRGREIGAEDTAEAERVAVVSQSFANKAWPGEEALGKRFKRGPQPEEPWFTVVGVAGDVRHHGRRGGTEGANDVYTALAQVTSPMIGVFLYPANAGMDVGASLRRAVGEVDPLLPTFDITPMREHLRREENESRFYAILTGFFALSATLLAVLGIYGLLAFHVGTRTREIGVRVALGADRPSIRQLVLRYALLTVGLGLLLGLGLAFGTTRVLTSLLYGIQPSDPLTFVLFPALFLLIAALAAYVPARRAMRIDPAEALRLE